MTIEPSNTRGNSTLLAHAKLNLALAVAPPEGSGDRAGWHRIASWMHCLELADRIELVQAQRDHVLWDDGGWADWDLDDDLAVRAARASGSDLRVSLSKSVPAGAGLGGGSADAAAVLRELAPDRAVELSKPLGSDIAFFLDGQHPARPAVVTGFGDEIERAERRSAGVVLFIAPFGCPTPEVYAAYDELLESDPADGFESSAERVRALAQLDPLEHASELFNDLESAACRVRPELGELLGTLRRASPRPVHLTGSGSASFCLVEPGAEQDLAVHMAVKIDNPELRVIATRLA